MKQLNLFEWADAKPSNIIDARPRFEAKIVAFVEQLIATNRLPPHTDAQIVPIQPPRGAGGKRGAA